MKVNDDERKLIDNIVTICMERDLRNPALVKETIDLISELRIEMKNILNVDAAFSDGFKNYLMQLDFINIQENDVDEVKHFIEQNLQSTVGYWTEEEVEKKALQWKSSKAPQQQVNPQTPPTPPIGGGYPPMPSNPPVNLDIIAEKRKQAKSHIASITTLDDAIALLNKLCDEAGEWLLDKINS